MGHLRECGLQGFFHVTNTSEADVVGYQVSMQGCVRLEAVCRADDVIDLLEQQRSLV